MSTEDLGELVEKRRRSPTIMIKLVAARQLATKSFPPFRLHGAANLLAPIGACTYIAGFAVPLNRDIPLLVLALTTVIAAILPHRPAGVSTPPVITGVLVFAIGVGLSLLISPDKAHSLRLSAPLLPAGLLFFLIAERCRTYQHTRLIFAAFSGLSVGLASSVLWAVSRSTSLSPEAWVSEVRSPILITPNDIILLAVVAPLSLSLLYREPRGWLGMSAAGSILLAIAAVCLLQSRAAILTMLVALSVAAAFLDRRQALGWSLGVIGFAGIVDWFRGFPLAAKFGGVWDSRLSTTFVAALMFGDAPLLGQGLHTYGLLYRSYLVDPRLPQWLPPDSHFQVPWAHNLYVETLAEQGLVGFVALVVMLSTAATTARRIHRAAGNEARVLAAGATGALVSLCFAALLELTLIRLWVAVTLFALLGVLSQLSSTLPRDGDALNHPNASSWRGP